MTATAGILSGQQGIDIFGDVHGHNAVLEAALRALGYESLSGTWRHPAGRRALFLGDLIDRGPANRATISTVRTMVEAGEAVCLMGNHELNAVHFATEHPEFAGQFLRPRSDKNLRQHFAFLQEYHLHGEGAHDLENDIAWLAGLPLWLELDGMQAIHACWSPDHLGRLSPELDRQRMTSDRVWQRTATPGDELMDAAEVILKGAEIELPAGAEFLDKDNHPRRHARLKWWVPDPSSIQNAVIGPPELFEALERQPELPCFTPTVPALEKPTFFGHYWFSPIRGRPWLAGAMAAGLDFGIARPEGLLGVYRWDGEDQLYATKLIGFDITGRSHAPIELKSDR